MNYYKSFPRFIFCYSFIFTMIVTQNNTVFALNQNCVAPAVISPPKEGLEIIYQPLSKKSFVHRISIAATKGSETTIHRELAYFGEKTDEYHYKNAQWDVFPKNEKRFVGFFLTRKVSNNKGYFRKRVAEIDLLKLMAELKIGQVVSFEITDMLQRDKGPEMIVEGEGQISFIGCEVLNINGKDEAVVNYRLQEVFIDPLMSGGYRMAKKDGIYSFSSRLGWYLKYIDKDKTESRVAVHIKESLEERTVK